MGMVQNNLENGDTAAGGAVPDILPYRYGPPSLSERLRLGPTAQLRSLYDPGVPL